MNIPEFSSLSFFYNKMDLIESSGPISHLLTCLPVINHLFIEMKYRQLRKSFNELASKITQKRLDLARCKLEQIIYHSLGQLKDLGLKSIDDYPEVKAYSQKFKSLSEFSLTCELTAGLVRVAMLIAMIVAVLISSTLTPLCCVIAGGFLIQLHSFSVKTRVENIELEQNKKFFCNKIIFS